MYRFVSSVVSLVCPGKHLTLRELPEFSTHNCNVIEGALSLYASNPPLNKSEVEGHLTPLSSIVEITSFLLVWGLDDGVDSLGQILPNLAVIRGVPLFRAYTDHFLGLRIGRSDSLKRVGLNHLTHMLGKNVKLAFWKNKMLQYFDTLKWEAILTTDDPKVDYMNNEQEGECAQQCNGSCWDESDCQIRE